MMFFFVSCVPIYNQKKPQQFSPMSTPRSFLFFLLCLALCHMALSSLTLSEQRRNEILDTDTWDHMISRKSKLIDTNEANTADLSRNEAEMEWIPLEWRYCDMYDDSAVKINNIRSMTGATLKAATNVHISIDATVYRRLKKGDELITHFSTVHFEHQISEFVDVMPVEPGTRIVAKASEYIPGYVRAGSYTVRSFLKIGWSQINCVEFDVRITK